MKRIKIMGLCLVTVFAMSAMIAASAQANVPYTSANGASTLNTPGVGEVTCTGATDKGEITGATTDTDSVTFVGCKTEGFPCNSAGEAAGTIKTNPLQTTIGWVSKANNEVGTDFEGVGGGPSAEFECIFGLLKVTTNGSVIGLTTGNTNLMSSTSTTTFAETAGAQNIQSFEGGAKDTLITTLVSHVPEKEGEFTVNSNEITTGVATNVPGKKGKKSVPVKTEINTSSGSPEYGKCVKKKGGKFSDANCTKKVLKKGKFEFEPS
jgi:hypothetical protein